MLGAAAIAGGAALVGLGATAGAATAPFPAGTTTFRFSSAITITALGTPSTITLTGDMTGTSDGTGNISFPAANIHFQPATLSSAGQTVKVTTVANGTAKATINTTTGVVTLTGSVTQTLDLSALLPGNTACQLGPVDQSFSSANSGGVKYTPTGTTATATVTGGVTIPAITNTATCPNGATVSGALSKTGTVVDKITIFPPGVAVPSTTTTTTTTTTVPAKASSSSVTAGGQITLSGNGWKAGSTVTLTLHSDPVSLGTATVDASGAFTKTVTIPADTTAGTHTISISGTDPAGAPRTVSLTITVSAATTAASTAPSTAASTAPTNQLPRTGSSSMPMTLAGLALLAVGGLLVLQGRRRVNAMR